jgi:hypothetical protein
MHARSGLAAALVALSIWGCKKEQPAPPPEPPKPAEAPKPAPAPVMKEANSAATPSRPGQSDRECVAAIDTAVPKQVTIAGKKAELNGYKLTFLDKDADDEARFGVLANIDEATPFNLFDLKRYVDWFKSEKAEAIIIDGDTGDSEEQIERALSFVADSGLPVFVEIGNHECKSDYNDALIAVQKTHDNVVDLGKVRYVDYDDADILGLPGYHDPQYVHCTTGPCIYTKNDADELKKVALAANDPVVLVVHGPPHGSTPQALDVIEGGKNIGDPNLNGLITDGKIPFGVFANVKESGGHATDLTGENVIKEGQPAGALYLNPGPADSEPWTMNDGTTSTGMAAMLTIKGKQASYKIYRAKKLTEAEKTEAAKLYTPKPAADAEAPEKGAQKPAPK